MTKAQKAFRFISVLGTMLACAWLLDSFAMLDQGETNNPIGFVIVWGGRLGAIGFVIAAGLSAIEPKAALRTLWASTFAAGPLAALFLFPRLWCLFLGCGPSFDELFWDPPALIPFFAFTLAIGGMHLSRPQ